jgi:hypothetical protein
MSAALVKERLARKPPIQFAPPHEEREGYEYNFGL